VGIAGIHAGLKWIEERGFDQIGGRFGWVRKEGRKLSFAYATLKLLGLKVGQGTYQK
jgi:hypothetical protein